MKQENNSNKTKDNIKLAKTKLSVASLILTILQAVMPLIASYIKQLNFLGNLPYVLAALILAIISKCKYNDKLSLIMIIVDAVLIGVIIMLIILSFLIFAAAINSIMNGCSGESA